MLELDDEPPVVGRDDDAGQERSAPQPARSVLLTLVPHSSIQFVDFTMAEEAVARIRRRFFEDTTDDGEPSLHVAATSDGVFHHPVTGAPCDPQRT